MSKRIEVKCDQEIAVPTVAIKTLADEFIEWLNAQRST